MRRNNEKVKNEDELLDEYFGTEEDESSNAFKAKNEREFKAEDEESIDDLDVYQDNFPKDKKVKRHSRALKMVSEAKHLADDSDEEIHSSMMSLENNLDCYNEEKTNLYKYGLEGCILALEKVGASVRKQAQAKNCRVFEVNEDVNAMAIKGVSRSKFASFMFALFFAFVAAVALIALSIRSLGMTQEALHLPLYDGLAQIMTWFSSWFGLESMAVGVGVYVVSVLLIGFVVYLLRVLYKANSNLHFAAKQLAEAELYSEIKQDEKYKVKQIDDHVKLSIGLFQKCAVFCNEQQGTLKRIIYIEGEKEDMRMYNRRSTREIQRTQMLVDYILDFLSEPVSKGGTLSEKSVNTLIELNSHLDKLIERLYRVRRDDEPGRNRFY